MIALFLREDQAALAPLLTTESTSLLIQIRSLNALRRRLDQDLAQYDIVLKLIVRSSLSMYVGLIAFQRNCYNDTSNMQGCP